MREKKKTLAGLLIFCVGVLGLSGCSSEMQRREVVVPNEFHMGYQGMQALAWQLQYHLAKAEDSETGYLVVDQEKLYEESNQKILFPIVQ